MSRKTATVVALAGAIAAIVAVIAATATASSSRPTARVAADRVLVKCGKTRTIAMAAPLTGDAASLGLQQLRWAQFFISHYNATHKKTKFRLVQGDTQLPNTAQALSVAHQFAANASIV